MLFRRLMLAITFGRFTVKLGHLAFGLFVFVIIIIIIIIILFIRERIKYMLTPILREHLVERRRFKKPQESCSYATFTRLYFDFRAESVSNRVNWR